MVFGLVILLLMAGEDTIQPLWARQFVLAYLLALKNTKRYVNANSLKLAPYEVSKWNVRDRAVSDLWHCAKVCRVANVMHPYLNSLS